MEKASTCRWRVASRQKPLASRVHSSLGQAPLACIIFSGEFMTNSSAPKFLIIDGYTQAAREELQAGGASVAADMG